jgi:hypothetical protein
VNDDVLVPLLYHVDTQCQIVLQANRELDETIAGYAKELEAMQDLDKAPRPLRPAGTTVAFRHLQGLLVAAAAATVGAP